MKLANGTYTLTSGSLTMKLIVTNNGDNAGSLVDGFIYNASLDVYVAAHVNIVLTFTDSTHFMGSTGTPPNQMGYSGTYA